jgi:hypothetical protein
LGVRPPTALLELWLETGVRVRDVDKTNAPRSKFSDAKHHQAPLIPRQHNKPTYRTNTLSSQLDDKMVSSNFLTTLAINLVYST